MPKVTVLMTVYNGSAYLPSSIKSILDQTFSDFEFLIIDDCSTDMSFKIIRSFQDARIKIVSNENNLGQTRSLNKGLSLSSGEYIARIDCDDLAFPSWLKEQVAFLEQVPQYALVSSYALVIDQNNRMKRILKSQVREEDIILRSLLSTPVNHVGSLMKRPVIESVGGYDETLKVAADYELWSKLLRSGYRLTTNPKILTSIRVHQGSVSSQEKRRGTLFEIKEIIKRNFKQLANYSLNDEEALLIAKVDYQPEELKAEDIGIILRHLSGAYKNCADRYGWSDFSMDQRLSSLQKNIYSKCLFEHIKLGNLEAVRRLSLSFRKQEGAPAIASIYYGLSFMGICLLRLLPKTFEGLHFIKAWFNTAVINRALLNRS